MTAVEQARRDLAAVIGAEIARPVPASVREVAEQMLRRHPGSIQAIVYYGSCLRRGSDPAPESVLDLYLLVDRYRGVYANPLAALANLLLPPNVFFAEAPWRGRRLAVKYAIISLDAFRRGCSRRSLHPRLWARFAQPVRLVYCRDDAARGAVESALVEALVTAAAATAGLVGERCSAADLWTRAFRESYRTELRAEGPGRAVELYAAGREFYERTTALALAAAVGARTPLRWAQSLWALRRLVGKPMNLLRLIKAAFTFEGGQGYILWKVRRHSGVAVTPTPWQRRHPLLSAPWIAWRLYRLGAFR